MEERGRRIGANEAVFREVNERLESLNEAFAPITDRIEVVCECGDTTCTDMISITVAEYEEIRSDGAQFLIRPGHLIEDVESVIAHGEGYDVVRKKDGPARRIAEAMDPR